MTLFILLVLGLILYFYSIRFLDAPISAGVRFSLFLFRLGFLFLLLFLLTRPQIDEVLEQKQLPTLFVGIDDTASMGFPIDPVESMEGPTRIQETLIHLENDLIPFWKRKGYELRFTTFSRVDQAAKDQEMWTSFFPDRVPASYAYTNMTRVIDSFERIRNPHQAAYLLLFTDGQWNRGGDPRQTVQSSISTNAESAREKRLYTFGLGTTRPIFDLVLDQVKMPSMLRAGEDFSLSAHVLVQGEFPNNPVNLKIEGTNQEGTAVFSQQQSLSFDGSNRSKMLSFDIPPLKEGEYVFSTEISPLPNELFTKNNIIKKGLRVRKSRDEILFLTSAPSWEFKFLKRTFEQEEYLQVAAYLCEEETLYPLGDSQWRHGKAEQTDPEMEQPSLPEYNALPDLVPAIDEWSVIVLHHFVFNEIHTEFARRLRTYIENGGSVLFFPGRNREPIPGTIQDILPVPISVPHAMNLKTILVDPESMAGGRILESLRMYEGRDLPPIIPVFEPDARLISGNVLLQGVSTGGERIDLIKQHRFGLGRIVSVAANSFWRWNFQTGKDILGPFWLAVLGQTKPQLARERGDFYSDGFLYETYQQINLSYAAKTTIDDATIQGIPVRVSGPSRESTIWLNPSEQGLNRFQANYTPTEPGEYTFANPIADATISVRVEQNMMEMSRLRQNVEPLRTMAEAGNGEYANFPAWRQLGESLPTAAKVVKEKRSRFLGEKWWIVLSLIFCLGMEWYIRWRQGLP